MKTPVLIAARNEAAHIAKTLEALPVTVEPIVIPNGCVDNTAEIAARAGATIVKGSPEGKMPALQHGLHHLGDRALEPLIILDADSYPLFPKRWPLPLLAGRERLDTQEPAVVVGPYVFNDIDFVSSAWRNLGHWRQYIKKARHDQNHGAAGCNSLIDLKRASVLRAIMDLPNIWPREDVAIKDTILEQGGNFGKSVHPLAIVATRGDRFPGWLKRIRLGRAVSQQGIRQSYLDEAAPGSVPYWDVQASKNALNAREAA
jgi:hypothetical protein